MPKIMVTLGLPASGKSTWAKELSTSNPETLRVNKDDLRAMLYGSEYSTHKEEVVDAIERAAVYSALGKGYDVIVDATNINAARLRQFGMFTGYPSELHWFKSSTNTCLTRNDARGDNKVPATVIHDMARKYEKLEGELVFADTFGKVVDHK